MPRRATPKHRATGPRTAVPTPTAQRSTPAPPRHRSDRPAARRVAAALAVSGVALATSGAAASGVLPATGRADAPAPAATDLSALAADPLAPAAAAALRSRGEGQASRSERRTAVDPRKAALLRNESRSGGQVSRTEELGGGDPRTIARVLMPQFGFAADQFDCLDSLWTKESGWDVHADNPTSSAYGIPQALPGSKMATAGADWVDNPATQIRWGLGYIEAVYGSPCGAWAHSQSVNWY